MEALSVKMVVLIFNTCLLLRLSLAFIFPGTHESTACISDENSLSCICKNREDISMSASMNFDISVIQVSGCGVVNIPFGAVPHLELDDIIFSDIITLNIRPFAFAGTQLLHTLQIEDIQNFNVWTHGFVGLLNVSNIIMRNISSMSLEAGAFGGVSGIENFLIENSNFGEITYGVFILTNITQFKVVDSKIDGMDSNSFLIHNAKKVLFQNCSIQEARNHSFNMAYVDSVTFSECNFGILEANSVNLEYSGSFNFKACTVSELNIYAITLMHLAKSLTFTHNVIILGYDYPLHLTSENSSSVNENLKVSTCCNSFLCNCDIYWMWTSKESFYDTETSLCIGTNTRIVDMVPVLDSHGNCMTLESSKLICTKNLDANFIGCQPISTGNLLRIPLTCIIMLYGLTTFIRSL